jgi:hypothetical protein
MKALVVIGVCVTVILRWTKKSDSIFGSRDDAGTQEKIEGSNEIMSEPRGTAETPQLQDLGSKLDSSHTIDSNSISIEADPKDPFKMARKFFVGGNFKMYGHRPSA